MSNTSAIFPEPDAFTAPLIEKLKKHPKRIVFSDGHDLRILQVAQEMVRLELGTPILLGNKEEITALARENEIDLTFVAIINPAESGERTLFCERLKRIERYRGIELANAEEVIVQPHYFAAMMVQYGHADGMIGGNQSLPAAVFRPVLHLIKPMPHVPRVFSAVVAVGSHLTHFGEKGFMFLADCGLNPDPAVEELAAFGVETGKLAHHYLGRRPRAIFLSHSTMGSSSTPSAQKMKAATEMAYKLVDDGAIDLEVDGELQLDVALDPSAAEIKLPGMERRREADVLIFPNLDAGHISLKLLKHVAGARIYGQLILGLARPAAQVPRTITVGSLMGTVIAIGAEAIKYHELYPDGEVL